MGTRTHRGRHARSVAPKLSVRYALLAVVGVLLVAGGAVVAAQTGAHGHLTLNAILGAKAPGDCPHRVRAVTATSFAPVLHKVAQSLAVGSRCVDVQVTVAGGQHAASVVAATKADVWIPDDASWRDLPNPVAFAANGATTIATSPLLFVMDAATAASQPAAARTWDGLAAELGAQGSTRLVISDPVTSGDGMVAGGALTYTVIESAGPLISAYDLLRAWQAGTTVNGDSPALPRKTGDVGIVPEYALLRSGQGDHFKVVAPSDDTALMRFTWYPTASGTADPDRSAALSRLRNALTDNAGQHALQAFGLRAAKWPAAAPPAAADVQLPPVTAPPMPVTVQPAMWHVLTTWTPAQRVANVLVVVDVSGSMGDNAPGTRSPLIALVRQGVGQVNALLPDTARLGLWQFGSRLAPPNDYEELVSTAPLVSAQRARLAAATATLTARKTGTGLYDTILAAYKYQQAHFQAAMPNEILLFTDGVNQDDPVSISLARLKSTLAAADPKKRVQIGVFAFGKRLPTDALTNALAPVGGQVDTLTNADEVVAAFVHAVSGGLTH